MEGIELWNERFARTKKVINLESVDRIPVIYAGEAFAPRFMGMTIAEYCADHDKAVAAGLATMDKIGGWDGANWALTGNNTPALSSIWLSRIAVPGRELPEDSLWQVMEAEVMTPDDYDTILTKGWKPFFEAYLPRVIDPREFMDWLEWRGANMERVWKLYQQKGYVIMTDAPIFVNIPFEYLCGGRSMTQFFFDLYRTPDKVEAVMAVIFEDTLSELENISAVSGMGGCWIGGWRSASGLLAPKLWDRFVWPYILKLADAIVAKGMTPILHWDQDWTRDLVRLQELPAKKCILNPDGMTDMKKFKALAGDRMAMMGDIPSSILAAGTPEDVDRYVREQVDLFNGTGLLLCPGCDAPINTKPENMYAFVEAAHN